MTSTILPDNHSASTGRLPLRFCTPPGWDEPDHDWQARHQGWQPPAGWLPDTSCPPAPAAWVWWERDRDTWSTMTAATVHEHTAGLLIAAIVTGLSICLAVETAAWDSAVRVLICGGVAFGTLESVRHAVSLALLPSWFDAHVRRRASALAACGSSSVPEGWFTVRPRTSPVHHRVGILTVSGALAATLILVVGATIMTGATTL